MPVPWLSDFHLVLSDNVADHDSALAIVETLRQDYRDNRLAGYDARPTVEDYRHVQPGIYTTTASGNSGARSENQATGFPRHI